MISYDLSDYGLKMWHQKCHRFFFYHSIYTYVFNTTLTLHSSPHTSLHMNCLSTTTRLKNSEKKQKAADM